METALISEIAFPMTKDQLKARLTELNVEFSEDAKKDELEAMLAKAEGSSQSEGEGSDDSAADSDSEEEKEEGEEEKEEAPAPKPVAKPVSAEKKPVPAGRKAHWPEGWTPSGDKVADTKFILDHAPKTMFMVPLAEGEEPGAEEIVQINGYKYTMKKGHMVNVPMPVAEMLANKYRVEMDVARRAIAFANKDKSEALS